MHSELDPKPAYIRTLSFCPRMTTNRQLPSSQRTVWAHQKHSSWACNLLRNGCSVSSLEWETPPAWEWVLLNNAASKAWPALPLPFPWRSISTAQSSTSSENLGKGKTKFFPHLSSLHQHKGGGRTVCVLRIQRRARLRWFSLNSHKIPPVCSNVGWSPLTIKPSQFIPGAGTGAGCTGSCQVRWQKEP